MSNPVPYFSDLSASDNKVQCKVVRKKPKTTIRRHLGLPVRNNFKLNTNPTNSLNRLFPTSTESSSNNNNSILAQVTTPKILEKQLEEVNQSHFQNLAAVSTAETLVKVANKRAKQFNPLGKQGKKRKLDIFDF